MTSGLPVACAFAFVAGYLGASLVQYALHRALGHRRFGRWFFRQHVGQHHTIYAGRSVTRVRYSPDERSLSAFYLLPASLLAAVAFAGLPLPAFAAFALGVALAYAANVWLHEQYHRERSRLAWLPGFARLRELHFVHHRVPQRNFAVVDLFWDRLFGTYAPAGSSARERAPNPNA